MQQGNIMIRFEGQSHSIDSNTLINTLIHYNSIVSEINKEYGGGSKNINIQINAIEKGSFVLDISVVENIFKNIFSFDSVNYVAAIVTILGGVIGAYKKLKGKPAKSDSDKENIKIASNTNVEINNSIINVYNEKVVREAISKTFETVNDDNNVEGLEVRCNQDITEFTKDDFPTLIYTDFDKEEDLPMDKDEVVDATLFITGLKFEKGGKWDFLWNGMKISMIVKDDALMKAIDSGERFGKGDSIRVKMRINKVFVPEYNTYINKSYKIIEFYEHIENKSTTQLSLD